MCMWQSANDQFIFLSWIMEMSIIVVTVITQLAIATSMDMFSASYDSHHPGIPGSWHWRRLLDCTFGTVSVPMMLAVLAFHAVRFT